MIDKVRIAEFDLHGFHPRDIDGCLLARISHQAWEMGVGRLVLIHGHGRNRGLTPGFVNTNTGYLGLTVRRALRSGPDIRQWLFVSTVDRGHAGSTKVRVKPNPKPSRKEFDFEALICGPAEDSSSQEGV
jgi:hypothetical protein